MSEPIFFNGIDGKTGGYAFQSLTQGQIAAGLRDERKGGNWETLLLVRLLRSLVEDRALGLIAEVKDPSDLAQAGWGVVFPEGRAGYYRPLLAAMLGLRQRQAGHYYKELIYKPNQTSLEFLMENGGGLGPVDPKKIPYYLLLVGSPEEIPFEIQFNIDIQHAVGRLHLDEPQHYQNYAQTVLKAEQRVSFTVPRAVLFGAQHPNDPPTASSCPVLIEGLADYLRAVVPHDLVVQTRSGNAASKTALKSLMGGKDTPQFLMTAGHCILRPALNDRQLEEQGALVCSDWGGPTTPGHLSPGDYFSAADIPDEAHFQGLVSLLFGCCSGGTPDYSHFPKAPGETARLLARQTFIAALPKRMLSVKDGCAAVVGHLDNVFLWSFLDLRKREQSEMFRDSLVLLARGQRLGHALENFHHTYTQRHVIYEEQLARERLPNAVIDDAMLTNLWFSVKDTRNYFILGDPAVRLPQPSQAQP